MAKICSFILPPGQQQLVLPDGRTFQADADGMIDIGTEDPAIFVKACGGIPRNLGNNYFALPTWCLYPGLSVFHWIAQKPVWRNTNNTGWVYADGTAYP